MIKFSPRDVLVADRCYFPILYDFKAKNRQVGFKLLDIEELLDRVSFRFEENPIPDLLRAGFEYDNAKKWMGLLRRGAGEYEEGRKILAAIPSDKMKVDPLGEYECKRGHVYLLEMDEERAIPNLLRKKGIGFSLIHLDDLDFPIRNETISPILYPNRFVQYCHVFALLRERLLKGEDENSFLIKISSEDEIFYLRCVGRMFGIEIRYRRRRPLFQLEGIRRLLFGIKEKRSFDGIEDDVAGNTA